MRNLFLTILLLITSIISNAQIQNTNFYLDAGEQIYFQKKYSTKLDISKLKFDTLVIVNDTLYVGQLRAKIDHKKYKIKKMTAPIHFKYFMYVEVTIDIAQDEYTVVANDVYWYVKGIGELTIEELFYDRGKLINKKYLSTLDSWFADLFSSY